MKSLWRSCRGLDRRVWLLALARAINTMGFSIVMPFLAIHLVEERGATGAVYGAVYLVAGLVAALGNLLAGEAADRLGRSAMMLIALLLRAVNMVLLGAAVSSQASIGLLAILVVVNALLRALFDPAASAAVTDLAEPAQWTAAFALQRVGANLGWALGPLVGGTLAAAHSYGVVFFVAAAIMLLAAAAVSFIRIPAPRPSAETSRPSGEPRASTRTFTLHLALVLLGTMATVQIFATLSVYSRTELGLDESAIGLLYTINAVLVVVLQVPAVAVIDRGGPRRALIVGPLVYSVAFLAVGLSQDFWHLAAAMIVMTAGEVVYAPALSDTAAHLGDRKRLGRAFGFFGLTQQLGVSLGPLAGGLAYDHLRHEPLLLWGAIAAAMALTGAGYAAFGRARLAPVISSTEARPSST